MDTQVPSSWVPDDGGRAEAGFSGSASDCFARAVAIASQRPYREIYAFVNEVARDIAKRPEDYPKAQALGDLGSARLGVRNPLFHEVMRRMGWRWTPTMRYGQGCKVHLRADELPTGRLVCRVSKHLVAVVDGVVHDTHDPSRRGTRCVYGYFSEGGGAGLTHETPLESLVPSPAMHTPRRVRPCLDGACTPAAGDMVDLVSGFTDDDSDLDMRGRCKRRRERHLGRCQGRAQALAASRCPRRAAGG